MKDTNNMNDKELWKKIKSLKWSNKADYKALAKVVYSWPEEVRKEVENFVGKRVHELGKAVDLWESATGRTLEVGSDDGFSDLRYHVVGLGEAEFNLCIVDPQRLQVRAKAGNYKESFAYCFLKPEPVKPPAPKEELLPLWACGKCKHGLWAKDHSQTTRTGIVPLVYKGCAEDVTINDGDLATRCPLLKK